MAYDSEILISDQKSVLASIRDPFTTTVCWEPPDDSEVAELMRQFDAAPDRQCISRDSESLDYLEQFVLKEIAALPNLIKGASIVNDRASNNFRVEHLKIQESGPTLHENIRPHTDDKILKAFFSFNRKAKATRSVPRAYAGNSFSGWYEDADMSRAVHIPGFSVYIIKLDQQVHAAPVSVPKEENRIVFTQDVALEYA